MSAFKGFFRPSIFDFYAKDIRSRGIKGSDLQTLLNLLTIYFFPIPYFQSVFGVKSFILTVFQREISLSIIKI